VTHRFVDTHCHFDFPPFTGNEEQSIAKAARQAFRRSLCRRLKRLIFVCWISPGTIALYAALGLHPIVIERHLDEHIERLDEILQTAGTNLSLSVRSASISIARIRSLNASRRSSTRSSGWQSARSAGDPPFKTHARQAGDAPETHRSAAYRRGARFSGSLQQAQRFIELGYKIGVGGTITYPRASKTRDVMAQLPLSALLLETDAPICR
jgi:TatD DNase family protein